MHEVSLFQRMNEYEPAAWALIPDLGLYMDQVVTYIERQLESLYGAASKGMLTPSMINNYVKSGLLPRPLGKKYYREHLALLMMIVSLKPVASMDDIAKLITPGEGETLEQLYASFCHVQTVVSQTLSIDPEASALQHAVTSAAYRLVAETLLSETDRAK